MITIIEQYRKHLIDLAGYEQKTVANYIACIYKFVDFIQTQFNIDATKTTHQHLKQWMIHNWFLHISNELGTHG